MSSGYIHIDMLEERKSYQTSELLNVRSKEQKTEDNVGFETKFVGGKVD